MKRKQFKIRTVVLALCVCFVAASLLSAAFILTHVRHEHDHNGPTGSCAACTSISVALDVLRTISAAAPGGAIVAFAMLLGVYVLLRFGAPRRGVFTLVNLKIRLNN
jgi:hypothetical protein